MAYVLWTRFLRHHPANPKWFDRDRFVLSAGCLLGPALQPPASHRLRRADGASSSVSASGEASRPAIRAQLDAGSRASTTGPLGQGFGNGVGLAIAAASLAARYNRPGFSVVDHFTYALAAPTAISWKAWHPEAASLAGHLQLGKPICLYDDNRITLAAGTQIDFTEDRAARFRAYGWHTQTVEDGNDVEAIDGALRAAKDDAERPSLILVRTHIGFGSPKHDSFEAHGSPLGVEDVKRTKEKLGWPFHELLVPRAAGEAERHSSGALVLFGGEGRRFRTWRPRCFRLTKKNTRRFTRWSAAAS